MATTSGQHPKSTSPLSENSEPTELLAIGIGRGSYVGPTTWKRTGVPAETAFKTKLHKLAYGGRRRDRTRHGMLAPEGEESSAEFTHARGVHDGVLPEEVVPFAASLERRRRARGGVVVESRSKIEKSDEELGALWVWLKRRR
ncbi:hypothetical protein E8E13_009039 [Curvularia kusanoi]|uniref:Uncharacterized protein n=1 Tax=Curvularia kusanoi TaxID=90978 RepID=A0A9P4TDK0_CURKU|nr:hypothetical protein E8E13_009039 [Curvularia kusanoi]